MKHVGVAIRGSEKHQNHVGILYRNGEEIRFSHLQWHNRLRDDEVDESYLWGECGLFDGDDINGQVFAARLLAVKKNGGFVPYGFYSEGNAFSEDGHFQPFREPGMGLTCATYVIQVFQSFGHNIAEIDKWEVRADDILWQEGILKVVAEHVSPQRASEVAVYVGQIRIRPEEAAAAVLNAEPPISFEKAVQMAQDIQELIYGSKSANGETDPKTDNIVQ
ncbi:hypothetical protein [Rhizobium sp. L245/93]|uniref:hypothetical protein n=1 Tax=Rhizobium sp. L245/93 TaxID=2819998 RepID=UPI001AD9EDF2|nr:hypothetical protein [Rhizobium sp. L245/93]MBO9168418.1 hypothetical protein [Rhizobium sp. L245/93]